MSDDFSHFLEAQEQMYVKALAHHIESVQKVKTETTLGKPFLVKRLLCGYSRVGW